MDVEGGRLDSENGFLDKVLLDVDSASLETSDVRANKGNEDELDSAPASGAVAVDGDLQASEAEPHFILLGRPQSRHEVRPSSALHLRAELKGTSAPLATESPGQAAAIASLVLVPVVRLAP